MAYGSWSDYIWTEVWKNTAYALDVQWRHKKDPIANKIWYSVCQWRIRKLGSDWFYDADCPIGIASITADRAIVKKSVNLQSVTSVIHNLTDVGREAVCKANGTWNGTAYLHVYCKPEGVSGPVPTGWYTKDITSLLPTIDRSGGTTTVSVKSKTYNSVTVNYTSTVLTTLIQYRINGGSWIDSGLDFTVSGGGTDSFTISGLSPNTAYTLEFRHRRDYNEVYSAVKSLSVTTDKPSAPTKGIVAVSELGYDYAQFNISGFSFGAGATWGKYQQGFSNEAWQDLGSTVSFRRSGLAPNTTYTMEVRLVDNYGTASEKATVSFTTKKPNLPTVKDLKLASNTYNKQTYTWAGSYGAGHPSDKYGAYEYRVNGGAWQSTGSSSVTISCSPNTSYKFEVRLKDYYGQYSSVLTSTATTPKPTAPITGIVEVSEITTNQAKITISGFSAGVGATLSHYQYKLNIYL